MENNSISALDSEAGIRYDAVLDLAAELAKDYLKSVCDRPSGVSEEAIERLEEMGGLLNTTGQNPLGVLRLLHEIGSPARLPVWEEDSLVE